MRACWFAVLAVAIGAAWAACAEVTYPMEVLPSERQIVSDEGTGAELTFLTSDSAADTNLYFHERSWLADESLLLFTSRREGGGLMGYLTHTGELVRLTTPSGGLGGATAAVSGPRFFAARGLELLDITLTIETPANGPTTVTARERLICKLAAGPGTSLNVSCDDKRLAFGGNEPEGQPGNVVLVVDVTSGAVTTLLHIPSDPGYGGHVQWSRTSPDFLSFAGRQQRLQVIDVRDGKVRTPYVHGPQELVTHESWWVNDQMLFCGGTHPKPTENADVKVLDVATGEVRVIGSGAWWEGATPIELAKVNWWHAAGSADGVWVAADNWHGDIMLFEGKTTRPHLLTSGHRTYGKGDHPHVGWDRTSEKVVFTSQRFGNSDVCVAAIPSAWRAALP